jgi:beta-galactosidase
MRDTIPLCSGWSYAAAWRPESLDPASSLEGWEAVELPHANRELPYNGFDEAEYQFVSTYARDLEVPAGEGRRLFLDFEGVMAACELFVDGKPAGGHKGGYTPFAVEITGLARPGARARLVVKVDSTERPDIPPFGHVIDYLCYGGIYREVALRVQEAAFLGEHWVRARDPLSPVLSIDIEARIDRGASAAPAGTGAAAASGTGGIAEARPLFLRARLRDGARLAGEGKVELPADAAAAGLCLEGVEGLRPWDVEAPALYDLELCLLAGEEEVDRLESRVGFRSAEWRPEGFFLNGRLLKLRGLNRHQSWPYSGYAMPARAQRRDAEILKKELGLNLVRTSHYPQSRHFLDACDELGLLVFEELPGWQHIGDLGWQDQALADLEAMILRDRNRPSIVIWGVRVNESKDDHAFYARTNALAARLDPTRARGGVRYLQKSELLEDVYTFNDFVHNGLTSPLRKPRKVTGLRRDVPYLVTEHNGHMFPTKRFDNEERLREHALRHARVLDAAMRDPHVAGAVGWCAFDYNTHKDFGSGDRICHHGVSDMFRIPKYAAALYASQKEPAEGVVLEAASLFAKGERSGARMLPLEIYTNCDEVEVFRGGRRIGAWLPDREAFPGLPHPPVVLRDVVGDSLEAMPFSPRERAWLRGLIGFILMEGFESLPRLELLRVGLFLLRHRMSMSAAEELVGKHALGWGDKDESWELVGRIGGKEAVRRRYGGDARADRLAMAADDARLEAAGLGGGAAGAWDCTRVVLRLEDQYGNLCPFVPESVEVNVSGPGRVLGPSRLCLIGGCIAFWVRTSGGRGEIRVEATGMRFSAPPLTIMAD